MQQLTQVAQQPASHKEREEVAMPNNPTEQLSRFELIHAQAALMLGQIVAETRTKIEQAQWTDAQIVLAVVKEATQAYGLQELVVQYARTFSGGAIKFFASEPFLSQNNKRKHRTKAIFTGSRTGVPTNTYLTKTTL